MTVAGPSTRAGTGGALLEVEGLRTLFKTDGGEFAAVDGVSFSVAAGRTLAIVGESGCGKSVSALSIMGWCQTRLGVSPAARFASRAASCWACPNASCKTCVATAWR